MSRIWQHLMGWLFPPQALYAVLVFDRYGQQVAMIGPRRMTRRYAREWFIDVAEAHWGMVVELVVKQNDRWVRI